MGLGGQNLQAEASMKEGMKALKLASRKLRLQLLIGLIMMFGCIFYPQALTSTMRIGLVLRASVVGAALIIVSGLNFSHGFLCRACPIS